MNLFQGLHDSRPALESPILVYCVRSVKKHMAKLLLNAMQFVTIRQLTDKQRTNNGNLSSSPISKTSSIRFLLSWMCLWSVSFWLLLSFVLWSLHPFHSIGTTISYPKIQLNVKSSIDITLSFKNLFHWIALQDPRQIITLETLIKMFSELCIMVNMWEYLQWKAIPAD